MQIFALTHTWPTPSPVNKKFKGFYQRNNQLVNLLQLGATLSFESDEGGHLAEVVDEVGVDLKDDRL